MTRHTNRPGATPETLVIEDGFNRRDADAVLAAYEDDAMLVVPPGGDLALGRDGIRTVTAEVLALEPEMTVAVVKRVEGDGMAVTHVRSRISVTSSDGDPTARGASCSTTSGL